MTATQGWLVLLALAISVAIVVVTSRMLSEKPQIPQRHRDKLGRFTKYYKRKWKS
jgi:hypothetical protein